MAKFEQERARLGDEIELNFFYHHYLRVSRFPVVPVPSSRVEFLFAHRCAKAEGASRCRKLLRSTWSDFVTFNDDATKRETLEKGLAVLHRLLREQFGYGQADAAAGAGYYGDFVC